MEKVKHPDAMLQIVNAINNESELLEHIGDLLWARLSSDQQKIATEIIKRRSKV